jgi:hypothetical protein
MTEFVKLRNPDNSQIFNLRVEDVSIVTEMDLKVNIINETDIAGLDLDIDISDIQINGVITDGVTGTDYPNSSQYPDDKHGQAIELEDLPKNPNWNYLDLEILSTIEWDRGGYKWERDGVVTSTNVDFNDDRGYYEFSVVFQELDAGY